MPEQTRQEQRQAQIDQIIAGYGTRDIDDSSISQYDYEDLSPLQKALATATRLAGAFGSGTVGFVPSPVNTPLAMAIGAGSEGLAGAIEGRPFDISRLKQIGAEGLLQGFPLGKVYRGYKRIPDVVRGAGLAELSTLMRRAATDQPLLPQTLEQALSEDLLATGLGGGVGLITGTGNIAKRLADEAAARPQPAGGSLAARTLAAGKRTIRAPELPTRYHTDKSFDEAFQQLGSEGAYRRDVEDLFTKAAIKANERVFKRGNLLKESFTAEDEAVDASIKAIKASQAADINEYQKSLAQRGVQFVKQPARVSLSTKIPGKGTVSTSYKELVSKDAPVQPEILFPSQPRVSVGVPKFPTIEQAKEYQRQFGGILKLTMDGRFRVIPGNRPIHPIKTPAISAVGPETRASLTVGTAASRDAGALRIASAKPRVMPKLVEGVDIETKLFKNYAIAKGYANKYGGKMERLPDVDGKPQFRVVRPLRATEQATQAQVAQAPAKARTEAPAPSQGVLRTGAAAEAPIGAAGSTPAAPSSGTLTPSDLGSAIRPPSISTFHISKIPKAFASRYVVADENGIVYRTSVAGRNARWAFKQRGAAERQATQLGRKVFDLKTDTLPSVPASTSAAEIATDAFATTPASLERFEKLRLAATTAAKSAGSESAGRWKELVDASERLLARAKSNAEISDDVLTDMAIALEKVKDNLTDITDLVVAGKLPGTTKGATRNIEHLSAGKMIGMLKSEIWAVARRLGHTKDVVDEMLASGKAPGALKAGAMTVEEELARIAHLPAGQREKAFSALFEDIKKSVAGEIKGGAPVLSKGQRGIIRADVLTGMAGAGVGAATNPDDPLVGALVGGSVGFTTPHMIRAAMHATRTNTKLSPQAKLRNEAQIQRAVQSKIAPFSELMGKGVDYYRATLLLHPWNLPMNAFAGPWGSGIMASMTDALAGDLKGFRMFGNMLRADLWMKEYVKALPRTEQILATGYSRAEGLMGKYAGQGLVGKAYKEYTLLAARALAAGDEATRAVAIRSGYTLEQAKRITLTSDPYIPFAESIKRMKTPNPAKPLPSALAEIVFPFYRTNINQIEQGLERMPIFGPIWQRYAVKHFGAVADPLNVQFAQQLVSGSVSGAAFVLGKMMPDDPQTQRRAIKAINNLGGQYGTIATTFFAMGIASKNRESVGGALVRSVAQETPLPSGINPIVQAAQGRLPGGVIPGMLDPREPLSFTSAGLKIFGDKGRTGPKRTVRPGPKRTVRER